MIRLPRDCNAAYAMIAFARVAGPTGRSTQTRFGSAYFVTLGVFDPDGWRCPCTLLAVLLSCLPPYVLQEGRSDLTLLLQNLRFQLHEENMSRRNRDTFSMPVNLYLIVPFHLHFDANAPYLIGSEPNRDASAISENRKPSFIDSR